MVSKASFITKIGPLVTEHEQFLTKLARTRSEANRIHLLKSATTEQLLTLVEICLNIVRSHFPLSTRQKNRLLPYADFIRRLSRARSERGARKLFVQTGSGVPTLLPALLTPILIEVAKSIISNNSSSSSSSFTRPSTSTH